MPPSTGEPSEFARVLSVLTFYIFSCGCLAARPRRHSTAKVTAHLWREEIENHPSLIRSGTTNTSTSNSSLPPSTPNNEIAVEPVCMIESQQPMPHPQPRIPPRLIHPPVNERHPPVVSAVTEKGETGWMTLPPPSVREIGALNRVINRQRAAGVGGGGLGGGSVEELERPGSVLTVRSAQTIRSAHTVMSLEAENLVVNPAAVGGLVARRRRFEEGVLDDMEKPRRRDTEEANREERPRTAATTNTRRRYQEGVLDDMEKPRPRRAITEVKR